MLFKRLDLNGMNDVYLNHLKKDFAADEVKPFSAIRDMFLRGEYEAFGFYEGDELSAYAFFVTPKGIDTVLLDYFAVLSDKRGSGIGSQCISVMKDRINKSIILETEHPLFFKSAEDKQTRLRRIAFYERNGLSLSGVHTRLFGVDFLIMQFKDGVCDKKLHQMIKDVYNCMFADIMNTEKVKIFDLEE